ncbi:hypothetical protein ASPWEDRAFT_25837 [Aspergillus wentii DTO 134E9]|uniref:Uncharacterized protein n=1 Tax=Aspergillus wentii DTO 134E9 TaxID=1073089 RepID=A0A1L9RN42_ASPWE|nr:uncharacterized protein ASPWEDRAFT_25837 [Aspergillus wentii DTO 134E9]OJJ36355.1 hypothetical protein ASPWEDRAFT_25837 [Aspergillus wentii DTO 134E9]
MLTESKSDKRQAEKRIINSVHSGAPVDPSYSGLRPLSSNSIAVASTAQTATPTPLKNIRPFGNAAGFTAPIPTVGPITQPPLQEKAEINNAEHPAISKQVNPFY